MQIHQREVFQEWLQNPLTQEYHQFHRDRRASLAERWARGNPLTPEHQAQAVMLGQLADISWEDIAEQYGIEIEQEAEV